jgi:hypothetical protein
MGPSDGMTHRDHHPIEVTQTGEARMIQAEAFLRRNDFRWRK